jgi:hypothetical protein
LTGGDVLGEFPDWVGWTRNLKDNGLDLEIATDAGTIVVPIDTDVLRPDLWEQLFDARTLVESHQFDDYSGQSVITYSVADCLSVLKAIYQEASVDLALPDPPHDEEDPREEEPEPGEDGRGGRGTAGTGGQSAAQKRELENERRRATNRGRLRAMVNGLQVHWDGRLAPRLREAVRLRDGSAGVRRAGQVLDSEGLPVLGAKPSASVLQSAALPFSVFSHMPSPEFRDELTVDGATIFDFHKALSTRNSYPRLLRQLGIVFDLDLPADFVDVKALPGLTSLWVKGATPATTATTAGASRRDSDYVSAPSAPEWSTPPTVRSLKTAVAHTPLTILDEGDHRYFFTAPRFLSDPTSPLIFGLLGLEAGDFGFAQLDVDGGMHKAIMLAETLHPPVGHNLDPAAQPQDAPNPEVFDPEATLPALRSGGLTLFADRAGVALLTAIKESKRFNDAVTGTGPDVVLSADDLVRGYRLDVWDSLSDDWHSLHLRRSAYRVGNVDADPVPKVEEGFVELAVTQPAPGAKPATTDLYVHEAIARWRGWSLSAPLPFRHLTRYPDAADALPDPKPGDPPDMYDENEPITPFRVTSEYKVVGGSLPPQRFGVRYRMRARVVDLAGNSLDHDDPLADVLSRLFGLPLDPEGFAYLRFEPVGAPLVVIRDPAVVTEPGSAVHRIVLRTFNASSDHDGDAADASLADRHVVPPRTSVEMGERLGMFDEPFGKLKSDPATWDLIATRDAGDFAKATITIAGGAPADYPVEPAAAVDVLPYLPEMLSVGAAIRDLPGTGSGVVGRAEPGAGPAGPVAYQALSDPNPRPGSATIVGFGGPTWEERAGFRLSLADPAPGQTDLSPRWDPGARVLTVYLPPGAMATVPLTSYVAPHDLKLLGVWQWLREYVESVLAAPDRQRLAPGADRIAHVLQRAVEGGHWMLTPPTLLTLVHAVQQPIGHPTFAALNVDPFDDDNPDRLQTAPARGPADPVELAPITAWRRLGSTDANLLGALRVHGASTARVDLEAEWDDPVDRPPVNPGDPPTVPGTEHHTGTADELLLKSLKNGYVLAPGKKSRRVGYYDPEHDQIAFVRLGDRSHPPPRALEFFRHGAPRHEIGDTKRHLIRYRAKATSRFQEYFPPDAPGGFTRTGAAVTVDVPASARPLAPDVVYVVPTFGWQRQADTNLKRSVRFGGGLRVYLGRPWYSSGEGELLGVALYDTNSMGPLDAAARDKFKPYVTQWGMDPIWDTGGLSGAPGLDRFPDAVARDGSVSLEEDAAGTVDGDPGRVDVAGVTPEFDPVRGLWFADLTIELPSDTYMPSSAWPWCATSPTPCPTP